MPQLLAQRLDTNVVCNCNSAAIHVVCKPLAARSSPAEHQAAQSCLRQLQLLARVCVLQILLCPRCCSSRTLRFCNLFTAFLAFTLPDGRLQALDHDALPQQPYCPPPRWVQCSSLGPDQGRSLTIGDSRTRLLLLMEATGHCRSSDKTGVRMCVQRCALAAAVIVTAALHHARLPDENTWLVQLCCLQHCAAERSR